MSSQPDLAERYLDLLKRCLTRTLDAEPLQAFEPPASGGAATLYRPVRALLDRFSLRLVRATPDGSALRAEGRDWPADAETMIGLRRLDHLHRCIADVLERRVPGDLLEAGVWRGGAVIFMRAALEAYGDNERVVWAADSFQGVAKPDPGYPADRGDRHWTSPVLAVPLEDVRANIERYGLLDERIRFLPGWFAETLPRAPVERLAMLRIDADLYESTATALGALYPKVSSGGYVVVDDYGSTPGCRAAVDDFRARNGIDEKLERIDWTGVYWRKETPATSETAGTG